MSIVLFAFICLLILIGQCYTRLTVTMPFLEYAKMSLLPVSVGKLFIILFTYQHISNLAVRGITVIYMLGLITFGIKYCWLHRFKSREIIKGLALLSLNGVFLNLAIGSLTFYSLTTLKNKGIEKDS